MGEKGRPRPRGGGGGRSYLRGPPGPAGGRVWGEPEPPPPLPPQATGAGGIVNTAGARGTLGAGGQRP